MQVRFAAKLRACGGMLLRVDIPSSLSIGRVARSFFAVFCPR
jgi:hypothetical protein